MTNILQDSLLTIEINTKSKYVMGVDINRRGVDETAIVIVEQLPFATGNDSLRVCFIETNNTPQLNELIGRVLHIDSIFNCVKIYVDTTGLGAGVTDVLKEKLGFKVEEVMFTRKSKPEMFTNLQLLMQQKKLKIPNKNKNNDVLVSKLYFQFLSIERIFESDSSIPRITHEKNSHDDIICALALACLYFKPGFKGNRGYNFTGFINS
jgi:phage FluMu gp28-like protein